MLVSEEFQSSNEELGTSREELQSLNGLEAEFAPIGKRIMQLNARVIEMGAEGAHLILLAIEDITERRRAQEALRESDSRKHAEEQVQQRQAELAHALRISTIGELASGLAHELNQPLSAIANGVEACARSSNGRICATSPATCRACWGGRSSAGRSPCGSTCPRSRFGSKQTASRSSRSS